MRVAVIGAGIGGLSVAGGLQRSGADVTVFERSVEPRVAGAGISIFGNGFTALRVLGLDTAVRELAPRGASQLQAGQRRPDGRWLSRTPAGALTELALVHRIDLHQVLLSAVPSGSIRWGADVTDVGSDGSVSAVLAGSSPSVEQFDLVIAADGINSRVRAGWAEDPGLRYSGYAAWRGVTSSPVHVFGAAGETWGRGLRFGIAPLADGRAYWFGVASMPARTTIADEFEAVERLFAGWHQPIPELLAATPRDAVFRLDINELAGPLPTFRQARVVLLGDAAHAMTPDLGQGGGQALEDAATLVTLLGPVAGSAAPDLESALDEYDRLRRPRTQRIARRAHLVGAVAQARNPVLAGLRDAVLRLTPGRAVAGPLLEVQAWQPPVTSAAAQVVPTPRG